MSKRLIEARYRLNAFVVTSLVALISTFFTFATQSVAYANKISTASSQRAISKANSSVSTAGKSYANPQRLNPNNPHFTSSVPLVPHGDRLTGPMSTSSPIQLDIALLPSQHQKLAQLLQSIYTPSSPQYHHYLKPGQFAQEFGPPSSIVKQVSSYLSSQGMTVGTVSSNNLLLPITTTVGTAESVFGTQISQMRLKDGKSSYINTSAATVPTAIRPFVESVVGLDGAAIPQPLNVRGRPASHLVVPPGASGVPPCSLAPGIAGSNQAYTTDQLFNHYGFNAATIPSSALPGAGQTVALFELYNYNPSDISQYEQCFNVSPTIKNIPVDGGTSYFNGEADLDVEELISLAPGATIDFYTAPSTVTSYVTEFNAIATQDISNIVSISYGICEPNQDQGAIAAENLLFEQMAAQGQSVLAASGDSGSEGCARGAGLNNTQLAVSDPASQPYVTGVGGTSFDGYESQIPESVWNDGPNGGAGGGGVSSVWQMPSWQQGFGVISSYSSATPCGAQVGTFCREVPDLSANADPSHGYVIFLNGQWSIVGGTSAATPLWASYFALANQTCSLNNEPDIGFANPRLYALAETNLLTLFGDVYTGNNDMTGSNSGNYPAFNPQNQNSLKYYYSMAAGLGFPTSNFFSTPTGSAYTTNLLCSQSQLPPFIGSISPAVGAPTGGTVVTIDGNNFSQVTQVLFGTTPATSFKIISNTELEVISPPGTSGTKANITILEGSLPSQADPPYDTFTYTSGPAVESLSINYGPASGGVSITINGTGFTGTTKVSFFTSNQSTCQVSTPPSSCYLPAKSFSVVSSTQITASTPTDPNPNTTNPCDLTDVIVTSPQGTSLTNPGNNLALACPPSAVQPIGSMNTGDEFAFTVLPIITSISTSSGPIEGHVPMTIGGYNFTNATSVAFGNYQVLGLNMRIISATQIVVDAPPVSYPGTVDVYVETYNPAGTLELSPQVLADEFTYVSCSQAYTTSSAIQLQSSGTAGGYIISDANGVVSACGTALYYGAPSDPYGYDIITQSPQFGSPIVGIATAPANQGYWEVDSEGHVYAFGFVNQYGDASTQPLTSAVVGIAADPSGTGYWITDANGDVFAYGSASFYGSTGNLTLTRPVVGITSTSDGQGYWLVASDGGIFAFGDAGFYGSTGNITLNQPIVGMAATPSGAGYWLVASDGGVFAFGNANFYGSAYNFTNIGIPIGGPVVSITPTQDGGGYWIMTDNGNVLPFGDAPFEGTL